MTARPAYIAAGLVVALVSAYLLGRASGPTRELRFTETVAVERLVVRERAESSSSASANEERKAGPSSTKWTPVLRPPAPAGCPPVEPVYIVERIEGPVEERKSASTDQQSISAKDVASETVKTVTKTVLVERARSRWAAGVDGGLRFSDATLVLRGRAEVRLLGPAWLGVYYDRQSAGAGVRLEW